MASCAAATIPCGFGALISPHSAQTGARSFSKLRLACPSRRNALENLSCVKHSSRRNASENLSCVKHSSRRNASENLSCFKHSSRRNALENLSCFKHSGRRNALENPSCVKHSSSSSRRKGCGIARASATAVPVITFDGSSAGSVEISLKTARPETAGAVVHRGVITELQNRRRGTASTLTRAEVRGGGRKPFKQKGTGQARRGSQRTPLRPGGGVVFGPKPVDWRIKINKKEKQLAISTAIQSAAVDAVVVEDLQGQITTPKTSAFIAALKRWGVNPAKHSLIFATEISKELELSTRNIKTLKILTPRSLNLYDILRADKVLFTRSGLQYLNDTYGASNGEFLTPEGGEAIDVESSQSATEEAQ